MEDPLERVTAIAQDFDRDEIPYSFGGAIALGYCAPARRTRDIAQMLDSMGERLDVPYVLHWMEAIVGTDVAPARELIQALARLSLLPAP